MENNNNTGITTREDSGIPMQSVNLNNPLPNLEEAEEFPFDLAGEYWTPEQVGEKRKMFFQRIAMSTVKDDKTGDEVDLECAFFLWQTSEGVKTVRNGSKRLVGLIQTYQMAQGTPLSITYLGKKKNTTNALMSDLWSVKPLLIKINSEEA